MHTIGELCTVSSRLLNTSLLLQLHGVCKLADNPNVNLLHDANLLFEFCIVNKSSKVTRQGSDQWFINRKKALVTASTLYSALGFRGMAEAKIHFQEFVLKQDERQFDDFSMRRMRYGLENEVC